MAIELTPKKRSKTSLFTTITGIMAVFLILVFVGTYIYFYITSKGLVERTNEIKEDSIELDNSIKSKEEELLVFQKRISDFASLILGHKNIARIFNFVDDHTIPTVWFNEFDYEEEDEGAFILSGVSSSFFLIEQQIVVFRNQELVKDARMAEVEIDEEEGLINFSLKITMDPEAFAFELEEISEQEPLLEVETPTQ